MGSFCLLWKSATMTLLLICNSYLWRAIDMKMLRNRCHYMCLAVLVLTALFLTFNGASAAAQTAGAGTINGTVSDASAAVIPGASVTVTNTDTGVSH